MITVSINEIGFNMPEYLKGVQQDNRIGVTSKGIPLTTVGPPANPGNVARARLRELAETAIIHDVVSPTGESWDAME